MQELDHTSKYLQCTENLLVHLVQTPENFQNYIHISFTKIYDSTEILLQGLQSLIPMKCFRFSFLHLCTFCSEVITQISWPDRSFSVFIVPSIRWEIFGFPEADSLGLHRNQRILFDSPTYRVKVRVNERSTLLYTLQLLPYKQSFFGLLLFILSFSLKYTPMNKGDN